MISSLPTPDFQLLFEAAPGLYLVLTPDFRIIAVSNHYLLATRTTREQILGRGLFEVFPDNPEDPAASGVQNLTASLDRVLLHRRPDTMPVQKYDIRRPPEEGGGFEERYWSPLNSPVLDEGGAVRYIIHRVEDVTEFIRLQQRKTEQDSLTVELRTRAERMESEIFLRQRELEEARRNEIVQREIQVRLEAKVRERTAELQASEERFRLLVDGSLDYAIYMLDTQGHVVSWNPGAERIKGYSAGEVLGKHFSLFYPREYIEEGRPQAGLKSAVENGRFEVEDYRLRKDGSRFWASIIITPLRDSDGILRGFSKITRDLTDRKLAEDKARRLLQEEAARKAAEERATLLWEQSERFRVTLQSIGDGVIVTDASGIVESLNSVAENLTGWNEFEARGRPLDQVFCIISEETRAPAVNPARRALEEGVVVGLANHTALIARDGTERPIADSAAPIRNVKGEVLGVVLVFRDVTEAKHLENQYRQSQKMEAVGQLAGGVAHDFNNLLTVILSYAEFLRDDRDLDSSQREMAGDIFHAAERAAVLTRQLLAFSRRQIVQWQVLDLNEVIAETGKMLERLIGEDVAFATTFAPQLSPAKLDRGQIEQVLFNLVVNARDAMPQGGRLTIETSDVYLDEEYAREHIDVLPGRYVMLAVSDTGCGMDARTRARMFEPFFTTKEPGKGTGLGLAMVFGIVKQSGGHFNIYSEPGCGTSFKIYFPAADPASDASPDNPARLPSVRGSETILLVEDEEMVRNLAARVLRKQGYTVLEASRGSHALELFQAHPGQIHLLLTDVVMPEMSGRILAEKLLAIQPDLKIVFMSGYTDDAIVRHGILDAGSHFIPKPLTPTLLIHRIREFLDHPA